MTVGHSGIHYGFFGGIHSEIHYGHSGLCSGIHSGHSGGMAGFSGIHYGKICFYNTRSNHSNFKRIVNICVEPFLYLPKLPPIDVFFALSIDVVFGSADAKEDS